MENFIKPAGEILIPAGDMGLYAHQEFRQYFFCYVSEHFPVTCRLPGNHEYYHSDISIFPDSFKEKFGKNIFQVNNISVIHEEVKLIFPAFWTPVSNENSGSIKHGMADFKLIRHGEKHFTLFFVFLV